MTEWNLDMIRVAGPNNASREASPTAVVYSATRTLRGVGRCVAILVLAIPLVSTLAGCGLFGTAFVPGDYAGNVPCTLEATNPDGETGSEGFDSATTLTVSENGTISVNGVELAVGNQVVFSIPTADLSFEVTDVARLRGSVVVTYEPRPTLTGITVEGELTQTLVARDGRIDVSSHTALVLTDVSGDSEFSVDCAGSLDAQ